MLFRNDCETSNNYSADLFRTINSQSIHSQLLLTVSENLHRSIIDIDIKSMRFAKFDWGFCALFGWIELVSNQRLFRNNFLGHKYSYSFYKAWMQLLINRLPSPIQLMIRYIVIFFLETVFCSKRFVMV